MTDFYGLLLIFKIAPLLICSVSKYVFKEEMTLPRLMFI